MCFGCTACFVICPAKAITMETDMHGFKVPIVKKQICIDCHACEEVCPANNSSVSRSDTLEVYAVKHKSVPTLLNSASGGLFTALSDVVLENDGVVYGAIQDNNLSTIHVRATSKVERDKQRDSKYVQSDLKNTFREVIKDLQADRYVMFTGTPCQIAGLKKLLYLRKINTDRLILVDLICNGVPSPLLYRDYILFCEKKQKKKIVKHMHRTKDNGWKHIEKNVFDDGTEDNKTEYSQAWKKIFYSGKALRECCYFCPYANMERVSDITIGDYWGVQNTKVTIPSDNGISLCLVNTKKGMDYVLRMRNVEIEKSTTSEAINKQPRLRNVLANGHGRNELWMEYDKRGADYVIKKYGECGWFFVFKHKIKKILIRIGVVK